MAPRVQPEQKLSPQTALFAPASLENDQSVVHGLGLILLYTCCMPNEKAGFQDKVMNCHALVYQCLHSLSLGCNSIDKLIIIPVGDPLA